MGKGSMLRSLAAGIVYLSLNRYAAAATVRRACSVTVFAEQLSYPPESSGLDGVELSQVCWRCAAPNKRAVLHKT